MRSCDGIEKSIRIALGFRDLEILCHLEIDTLMNYDRWLRLL